LIYCADKFEKSGAENLVAPASRRRYQCRGIGAFFILVGQAERWAKKSFPVDRNFVLQFWN